ncbi:hypothetical protein [Mesorhizobium carmichaelinearum]|uniref:hypothetical protein n=1 Tax=Mesorhizobium carmichaelinearum TaxID=1208188 RepID=UPI0015C80B95|nr:hypothetical protein [Mesorhizobium carmichaelinearum]
MADVINKVTFTGLESQICDAFNMVDVLMDMCETHFCKSGDDNIIVTSTEAARLFFIACQALPHGGGLLHATAETDPEPGRGRNESASLRVVHDRTDGGNREEADTRVRARDCWHGRCSRTDASAISLFALRGL